MHAAAIVHRRVDEEAMTANGERPCRDAPAFGAGRERGEAITAQRGEAEALPEVGTGAAVPLQDGAAIEEPELVVHEEGAGVVDLGVVGLPAAFLAQWEEDAPIAGA